MIQLIRVVDNVPRQIYSYGANRNTVYVGLGSHFAKWPPKKHCGRIVFCIMNTINDAWMIQLIQIAPFIDIT